MRLLRRAVHSASTVNPAEIAHFSRLSSQWWDEKGEFSFLHQMNPVRMRFIREKLLETARDQEPLLEEGFGLRNLDVLDIGCGGGLLSESLARSGANTLGVDASEANISIARLHATQDPAFSSPSTRLSYLHTPAEALLKESKRYDVVCSMEVLEHVDNPSTFLDTCSQLVKPGGHLFLSTISRTPLAYFLTIFMAEDVLGKVSKGTHTHSKFIRPEELTDFFRRKLHWIDQSPSQPPRTQAEVRGLVYNPLASNWILAPRGAYGATAANYLFWVRKPIQYPSESDSK
ncbi:Ubiquinone biosynthesis O-methyltransferase, mitochondrial [Mycena indigotica]|uniref:Ubiquinone biosynthesis O-methyltransferase, mitochondrial n=1 Tax=Mycena indigotica TaxID=2126181 RepID=A0A8H6T972_9AGAR|nr:Ubiquinone biosynthesis O-methyltransferase, mitochondrial [Mycena indigotica]KAF7312267.1 Ubiquinone biosynthesis O-methyltransferase, mitochondrial [Mycena indigotica]